jgi:hypothetical protein
MRITLAQRDLYLLQIETEIKNREMLLIKKKKDLDKKYKVNHYLNDVKENYSKYYEYILNEKQQQHNALLLLKEYMNNLINTEDMLDEQLRIAKHDQKYIMKEIDRVKTELDELIE